MKPVGVLCAPLCTLWFPLFARTKSDLAYGFRSSRAPNQTLPSAIGLERGFLLSEGEESSEEDESVNTCFR